MMKNNLKIWIAPIVLTLLCLLIFLGIRDNRKLHSDYLIAECVIVGCSDAGKGHGGKITVHYTYAINGVKYNGDVYYSGMGMTFCEAKLVGRTFPLAYSNSDHSLSTPLVLEEDFDDFKIAYPDSLKWVNRKIKSE